MRLSKTFFTAVWSMAAILAGCNDGSDSSIEEQDLSVASANSKCPSGYILQQGLCQKCKKKSDFLYQKKCYKNKSAVKTTPGTCKMKTRKQCYDRYGYFNCCYCGTKKMKELYTLNGKLDGESSFCYAQTPYDSERINPTG